MNEFITADNNWRVAQVVHALIDYEAEPWGKLAEDGVAMPAFKTAEEIEATWLREGSWPSVDDVRLVIYETQAKWAKNVTFVNGGFRRLLDGTIMGVELG